MLSSLWTCEFLGAGREAETGAPSGDLSLSPSWLHARHSYNPTLCGSQAWELYLFPHHNWPHGCRQVHLMLPLLEGCIIAGFSTCVPQLQGGHYWRDRHRFSLLSIRLAACLSRLSVYTSGPSAFFVCLFFLSLSVCLPSILLPCLSFWLTAHYCSKV